MAGSGTAKVTPCDEPINIIGMMFSSARGHASGGRRISSASSIDSPSKNAILRSGAVSSCSAMLATGDDSGSIYLWHVK